MSSQPTLASGKICYLEIPSRDIKISASFYHTVFGWEMRTRGDGSTAFDDSVNEVSGAFRTDRDPSNIKGLVVHIMIADIHSTIEAIKINGGKIVQEIGGDAPEITAHFEDPFGNVFGLYQEPSLANK